LCCFRKSWYILIKNFYFKGGFLAKNWCTLSESLNGLSIKSYLLHEEFGKKFGDEYGFRNIPSYNIIGKEESILNEKNKKDIKNLPKWITGNIESFEFLGEDTSQLYPKKFTKKILKESVKNGVKVINETVIGLEYEILKENNFKIKGVKLENNNILNCNQVVNIILK
jgi:hypothetical protein